MRKITKATKDAPYPYNLIHDAFYDDIPLKKLAPDMDQSLQHVMSTMPERVAVILQLKYRDGQSVKEIADHYGITSGRINQILRRGMRLLRHPSRSRYFMYGYKAVTERDERKRLQAQYQKEQLDNFLRPDRFTGPLSEIPDARDRADAILARCWLDDVYHVRIPTCAHFSLQRAGIDYVWQLCFARPDELLKLRDIGPKRAAAIERSLNKYQLALDDGTLSADPQVWDYLNQRSQELKQLIQETS